MSRDCIGQTRLGTVDRQGLWSPRSLWVPNKRMATGGFCEAQCCGLGNPAYRISAAYLEFTNVGSPSDVVSTPTPAFNDTIAYYTGLAFSGADFLRLPLQVMPELGIAPGDEADFATGQGNLLTFFVQSTGVAGFYGLSFSNADNSKVYGVALVATPVPGDQTQDILFARAYYTGSNQLIVPAFGQVGVQYQVTFGPTS